MSSTAAADIIGHVKISDIAKALGYPPLRNRIAAPWRETGDLNITLSDEKNCWHDFVTGEGGGVLALVVKVRGCSKASALHFLADLAGIKLDDRPLSAADRRRWAAERRALERDLPTARYWQRATVSLCDEKLVELKSRLFDPLAGAPAPDEIRAWTAQRERINRLSGAALVVVYREASRREPAVTAGMVRWAKDRERAEVQALCRYLEFPQSVAVTYLRGAA